MKTHADPQPPLDELARVAEAQLLAAEAQPLGDPFDQADGAVLNAIERLRQHAEGRMFPDALERVDGTMLATFNVLRETFVPDHQVQEFAEIHQDALATWPEFAVFIRGPIARRVLADGARHLAARTSRDLDQYADAQVTAFERLIAGQLGDDPDLGNAARCFLLADELQDRLGTLRQRHLDHAAAEASRVEAERRAAAEAIAAAERDRRAQLADYFRVRPSRVFQIGERAYTGAGVVALLEGVGARDIGGDLVQTRPGLDAIDLAARRARAADAVTA